MNTIHSDFIQCLLLKCDGINVSTDIWTQMNHCNSFLVCWVQTYFCIANCSTWRYIKIYDIYCDISPITVTWYNVALVLYIYEKKLSKLIRCLSITWSELNKYHVKYQFSLSDVTVYPCISEAIEWKLFFSITLSVLKNITWKTIFSVVLLQMPSIIHSICCESRRSFFQFQILDKVEIAASRLLL
jgi:hypothetical protein